MSSLYTDGVARASEAGRSADTHRLTVVGRWPQCSCGYEPAAEEAGFNVKTFEHLFDVHFDANRPRVLAPSLRTRARLVAWRRKRRAR